MQEFIVTDYGVKTDFKEFQTKQIQAVIDLCKTEGGKVIIPAGEYYISSLWLWSNTTLYLESGAKLIGSEEFEDYIIYDLPDGIESRNDKDYFRNFTTEKSEDKNYNNYRKAMISAYAQENISIIGEEDTVIDGRDCYNGEGDEGFRGPHGIYLTNCKNVTLKGYTIQNSGSFMHQIDNCKNMHLDNVTCLGGHDGTHMHFCENVLIENCKFITGDDCIAGANMRNITVKNCELNTSCQVFRVGGKNVLIEDCYMYGPGYYPHRMTIVKGKNDYLPREEGRHNTLSAFIHFAGKRFPDEMPYDVTFKNCKIENIDNFIFYNPYIVDTPPGGCYQQGAFLTEINIENVKVSGLVKSSVCVGDEGKPLTINVKNFEYSFNEDSDGKEIFGEAKNTKINYEN